MIKQWLFWDQNITTNNKNNGNNNNNDNDNVLGTSIRDFMYYLFILSLIYLFLLRILCIRDFLVLDMQTEFTEFTQK